MTFEPLRILLVEDDFFIAETLAREIRAEGDTVVGPFADIHEAIQYVGLVQAAILDVLVQEETSFSIADSLIHHEIPFIFLTGSDPRVIPARFADRHIYDKPSPATPLLYDLHQQHRAIVSQGDGNMEAVVIEMIRRARDLMPDEASADRIVEGALLRAIAETKDKRMEGDIRANMLSLLYDEYRQRGRLCLH
ncbi:response regulator [Paracoccus benzoatiresistens]|uniref:Response regulator n=1 Tax=Paracoccus benzoatiresistens TaxID=2997341 RepID=A0ABT4JCX6_9RHOB|nr:response regulator [Paracoccus sp. EF6]MCZ0964376.1 response regulator [Paracoccus sp. EF6]